jgi:glycosyltransferase involved in cell wall biosynthesis
MDTAVGAPRADWREVDELTQVIPRIGLFADRLDRGTRVTGVGTYITGLANGLAAVQANCRLILFSARNRAPFDASLYGGIAVRELRVPRRVAHPAWAFIGWPRVNAVDGKLDLVHNLVPAVPIPTCAPLVVTIHDLIPLKQPQFFSWRNRTLFARAMAHACEHAGRLIAVSEATRRDAIELLDFPPQYVDVVHLGVRVNVRPTSEVVEDVLARHALSQRRYLLFVGEITRRKNPVGLVAAFGLIAKRFTHVDLVLIGTPGIGFDEVRRAVADLRLGERVKILGHVRPTELAALINAAAALVLPSFAEGFGLPPLEAMSLGTPVVVSDAGSLPEVVGDAGVVVPTGDTETLANAVARLLDDDDLRRELSTRGLERAKHFTWERAARETVAVYDRVAAGDARG